MRKNPHPPNNTPVVEIGNPHIYLRLTQIQSLLDKKQLSIYVDKNRIFKIDEKLVIKCRAEDSNNDITCLVSVLESFDRDNPFNYNNRSMLLIKLIAFQVC